MRAIFAAQERTIVVDITRWFYRIFSPDELLFTEYLEKVIESNLAPSSKLSQFGQIITDTVLFCDDHHLTIPQGENATLNAVGLPGFRNTLAVRAILGDLLDAGVANTKASSIESLISELLSIFDVPYFVVRDVFTAIAQHITHAAYPSLAASGRVALEQVARTSLWPADFREHFIDRLHSIDTYT